MDKILNNESVVCHASIGNEAALKRANNRFHEGHNLWTKTFEMILKSMLHKLMGRTSFMEVGLSTLGIGTTRVSTS